MSIAWPQKPMDDSQLRYLSPLGWEYIDLTGDC